MADINRRNAAVGSVRRISNTILEESYNADRYELGQEQQSLQMHFERFVQAHDTLVAAAESDELAAHMELWDNVETQYNRTMVKIRRLLAAIVDHDDNCAGDGSVYSAAVTNGIRGMTDLRLDPVTVPTFDGRLQSWLAFKDAFETLVHNPDTPEAYKLAKLRVAVKGDAVQLVGGMYTGGYPAVWQALKDRYDNPKQLAEIHVSRFITMKAQSIENTSTLLAIVDTVRESLRALTVMHLPVNQWDALAVPIVTSKLPQITQQAWGMSLTSNAIPTLEALLAFIEKRAHSLTSDILQWTPAAHAQSNVRRATVASSHSPRLVKTNLAATAPGNCECCDDGGHYIGKCPQLLALPVAERFQRLKGSNLCFNCLRPGHSTKVCQSGNCRNCNGKHHTLLCRTTSSTVSQSMASKGTSATNSTVTATVQKPPQNHTA